MSQSIADKLETLKQYYVQVLELERSMRDIISEGDLSRLSDNTSQKKMLMDEIKRSFTELLPHLEAQGSSDPQLSQLRESTRNVLQELLKLEEENSEALRGRQATQIAELRQNASARRFARGYKPGRENMPRARFDKKG